MVIPYSVYFSFFFQYIKNCYWLFSIHPIIRNCPAILSSSFLLFNLGLLKQIFHDVIVWQQALCGIMVDKRRTRIRNTDMANFGRRTEYNLLYCQGFAKFESQTLYFR